MGASVTGDVELRAGTGTYNCAASSLARALGAGAVSPQGNTPQFSLCVSETQGDGRHLCAVLFKQF